MVFQFKNFRMWAIFGLLWLMEVAPALAALDFDDHIVNVTVKERDTAILPCSVINLGSHKIIWTDQTSTLLAYTNKRIIDDDRMSIERPYDRDWNLHIRDVKARDEGMYHCQINTEPVRIKMVYLNVLVPARIVDSLSTHQVTISEGEKVTLVCNATGDPRPVVTWYRMVKDDKGQPKQKVGVDGEVLVIHNVTRYCGGSYQCVAFNGITPAATRVIVVSVKFPPEVNLPNKRIGQMLGKDTILECTITAHPMSDVWWERNGDKISSQDHKYRVEIYDEADGRLTISLRIFNIVESDFGIYTCFGSNSMGQDQEQMTLYDYNRHLGTTTTTPPPTTTIFYMPRKSPTHEYNHHYTDQVGVPHVTNGRHHENPNTQDNQYRGRGGDDEDDDYWRGQGQEARRGSLTGSRGSESHIYTPTYQQGGRGNVGTSSENDNSDNRSCHMYPSVVILVSITLVSSWLVRNSPIYDL